MPPIYDSRKVVSRLWMLVVSILLEFIQTLFCWALDGVTIRWLNLVFLLVQSRPLCLFHSRQPDDVVLLFFVTPVFSLWELRVSPSLVNLIFIPTFPNYTSVECLNSSFCNKVKFFSCNVFLYCAKCVISRFHVLHTHTWDLRSHANTNASCLMSFLFLDFQHILPKSLLFLSKCQASRFGCPSINWSITLRGGV